MTAMEILLLLLGIGAFVASFIVPETLGGGNITQVVDEAAIKDVVDRQVKEAESHLEDVIDESVHYAIERTQRDLERLSNEKMTAVSEFSETVLTDIHKNHNEVMFLYDMLQDKQEHLKETAASVDKTKAEAKEAQSELAYATSTAKQMTEELHIEAEEFSTLTLDLIDVNAATVIGGAEIAEEEASATASESMPEMNSVGNNNEEILRLHKAGRSNIAIAKELGLGVGEVNLVIDLFEVM